MKRTLALTALALGTLLTVSGCSAPASSDDTEEPTSSASAETDTGTDEPTGGATGESDDDSAPATGAVATGDGYSYEVPEGWTVSEDAGTLGADTLATAPAAEGAAPDSLNVILSPAGAVTPDQVEASGAEGLEAGGATEVTVQDRVTVDGAEGAHLSATLSAGDITVATEQYYLAYEDRTYIVTFSFGDATAEADRAAIADSVLASWTWS
jgi:hypothetical protein